MTIGEERSFLDQLMDRYRAGDSSATDESPGTLMVRTLQSVYLKVATQDYAGAANLMTEDFELEILGPREIPVTGYWKGRSNVLSAMQTNFGLLEDQLVMVIGVSVQGSAVLVMGRESGVVRETQRPYSTHWVQWFTFRGDTPCRMLELFDDNSLFQAFGTSGG